MQHKLPVYSIPQIASIFDVSETNVIKQYQANLDILKGMLKKAIVTGKKVNDFTKDQLQQYVNKYEQIIAASSAK